VNLTRQFTLLNLPSDPRVLSKKIKTSIKAFKGELPKELSEYLFVVEDLEEKVVVGSSLIMAKHGTEEAPHHYFKVVTRNHYSEDIGLGFIHQVLQFKIDVDGPTEIGGLLVDRGYRKRPEKIGKQIALSRFLFMAMEPDRFESKVLCELTPVLHEDGRSDFWEALGRRFTGLPYQEADLLSQSHKEFMSALFPQGDIYLCLLDTKARTVLGRVGQETKPAQHLLESIGFSYCEEVDPFDGGPHYSCELSKISTVKKAREYTYDSKTSGSFEGLGIVGRFTKGEFRAVTCPYKVGSNQVLTIPVKSAQALEIEDADSVWMTPI
jgi:arginine N-succinyltransferase